MKKMGLNLDNYVSAYIKKEDIDKHKEWVLLSAMEETKYGMVELTLMFADLKKKMTLSSDNVVALSQCFGSNTDYAIGKILVLDCVLEAKSKKDATVIEKIKINVDKTKARNQILKRDV